MTIPDHEKDRANQADMHTVALEMIKSAVDGTIDWEDYPDLPMWAFEGALEWVNRLISQIPGFEDNRNYHQAYNRLAAQATTEEVDP